MCSKQTEKHKEGYLRGLIDAKGGVRVRSSERVVLKLSILPIIFVERIDLGIFGRQGCL